MKNVNIELYEILISDCKEIDKVGLKKIVSDKKSDLDFKQLINIITMMKVGNVSFEFLAESNEIILTDGKIKGKLEIYTDENGLLDKMFILPCTDTINTVYDFKSALDCMNIDYSIIFSKDNEFFSYNSERPMAVSSMIKVIIAEQIYKKINEDVIHFNTAILFSEEDMSVLSSGFSKKDIGRKISIKELLFNMLIISDNTAMDMLLKLLVRLNNGKNILDIKTTKVTYGEAWCFDDSPENIWRMRALSKVAWNIGHDYFISLKLISDAIEYILKQEWIPWDDLNIADGLVYKGGSAPGVLSCLWIDRNLESDFRLIFSINRKSPLSMIEELYVFDCANKLIQNYKDIFKVGSLNG